jgi:excisionase family DNA binding protein
MNNGDGLDSRPPGTKSDSYRSQLVSRRLVSLADAAEILGMSVASVRRLVCRGKLQSLKLTRRVLIDVRDVEKLIEQSKARGFWQ